MKKSLVLDAGCATLDLQLKELEVQPMLYGSQKRFDKNGDGKLKGAEWQRWYLNRDFAVGNHAVLPLQRELRDRAFLTQRTGEVLLMVVQRVRETCAAVFEEAEIPLQRVHALVSFVSQNVINSRTCPHLYIFSCWQIRRAQCVGNFFSAVSI